MRKLLQRGPGLIEDLAVLAADARRRADGPQPPPRFGWWRPSDVLILAALALAVLGLLL